MKEVHHAQDRRCYNGQMCADLQREHDQRIRLEREVKELAPEAHCCYFPMEGKYSIWLDNRRVSDFYDDARYALVEALNKLEAEL